MCGHQNSCSETLFSRQKAGDEPRRVVSCDDDDDDGGGGHLCRSCRWLVVALLTAAPYCCRSSHTVIRSPMLSSPAAFTAFAAPVIGWYLHCRPPPDLVITPQCAIFNSLIASPAAARLCHSRRWLVVESSFVTHFHCPTPAFVDARCRKSSTLLSPAAFAANR